MKLNIYLHGHGSVRLKEPRFQLPFSCSISFYNYCNSLMPQSIAHHILQNPSEYEPVEIINEFMSCTSTYLHPVNNPSMIAFRESLFGDVPQSVLLCVEDFEVNTKLSLSDIIESTKSSYSQYGFQAFSYHWLTCRCEKSLNDANGQYVGWNSGFHLNDPNPDKSGMFKIAPHKQNFSYFIKK